MGCGCQNQNDQVDDFCPDAEATDQIAEVTTNQSIGRRTLLKAAGVGATVAALAGREGFSPFSALAHTDTKSACTANDIAVSNGTITNEPCDENQTFNARAVFLVSNNNNSRRVCITLHMGSGPLFGGKDFLLKRVDNGLSFIAGNQDVAIPMYADLGPVPANFAGACYPGTVVAFQTAQNSQDPVCPADGITKYPGGQCKRQEICIVGFGATLACANGSCSSTGSSFCDVPCGGTLNLYATATGASEGATGGTYTYTLFGPGGTQVGNAIAGATACFSVANPVAGTYTVHAADSKGCFRAASVEVTVSSMSVALAGTGGATCGDGKISFTATPTPAGAATYEWFVGDGTGNLSSKKGPGSDNTFTYDPVALGFGGDGLSHKVKVVASRSSGACTANAEKTVTSCVRSDIS